METINKLSPHRTMYVRGVDRRGAAAAMHDATSQGFTVSGCWSDQADFAVPVLFDADDNFGNLFSTRYLPDFSLAGVTLDFDLTLTGAQHPLSHKYASVAWDKLSYITAAGVAGTEPLRQFATSTSGQAEAVSLLRCTARRWPMTA